MDDRYSMGSNGSDAWSNIANLISKPVQIEAQIEAPPARICAAGSTLQTHRKCPSPASQGDQELLRARGCKYMGVTAGQGPLGPTGQCYQADYCCPAPLFTPPPPPPAQPTPPQLPTCSQVAGGRLEMVDAERFPGSQMQARGCVATGKTRFAGHMGQAGYYEWCCPPAATTGQQVVPGYRPSWRPAPWMSFAAGVLGGFAAVTIWKRR